MDMLANHLFVLLALGLGNSVAEYTDICRSVSTGSSFRNSGSYMLDPDGTSGPLSSMEVECVKDGNQVMTVVRHNLVKSEVKGSKSKSWKRKLQYKNADSAQLAALISRSEYCYQEIVFDCKGVSVLEHGEWMGGDRKWHRTVGGAGEGQCTCSRLEACASRDEACNCNSDSAVRADRGRITQHLPVMELALGGVQGSDRLHVSVGPLKCSDKPIDIPRDCQEAKEKFGVEKNGVVLIDIDGADGDSTGNLEPVYVHCDVESYSHVAVTQVPTNTGLNGNARGENYVFAPVSGRYSIDYTQSKAVMQKLIEHSSYCSQDIGYRCKNSGLLGGKGGYWRSVGGSRRNYWGSSMETDNKCACGVTGTCEDKAASCNCNVFDGNTRQDFGVISNKDHLPVDSVSVALSDESSRGEYYVGWLSCSRTDFGLEPSCQWYRAKDWSYSYTFLIDPDGPLPLNPSPQQVSADVQAFPVHCEFSNEAVLGVTTLHYTSALPTSNTITDPIRVEYPATTTEAMKALTSRSVYCSQEIVWNCWLSPVHRQGENVVYWENIDNEARLYFHGTQGDACECNGRCNNFPYKCNCDANSKEALADKGLLMNKDDLPVTVLHPSSGGYFELGALKCYEVWRTCDDFQQQYVPTTGQHSLPATSLWVLDPDGPLGAEPFPVFCRGEQTVISITENRAVSRRSGYVADPEAFAGPYRTCYNISYSVTREKLRALTEASPFCTQYFNYKCIRAPFTDYVQLISREYETMGGWAPQQQHGSECMCGEANSCAGGTTTHCHCDMNDGEARWDESYLVDKSMLPVLEVCMGYDEKQAGEHRMSAFEIGELVCSAKKTNVYVSCQRLRDEKPRSNSDTYLLDPSIVTATDPDSVKETFASYEEDVFVAYCEMSRKPPVGGTVINPSDSPCSYSQWTDVTYNNIKLKQVDGLKQRSTYCYQDLILQCLPDSSTVDLSNMEGWYDRYHKHRSFEESVGSADCTEGECQCDENQVVTVRLWEDISLPLEQDTDKASLPVTRMFHGAGAKCVNIGALKCFEVYKDCAEIKASGQYREQVISKHVIDPDGAGGVEPFSVTCDFKTNQQHPITVVSHNEGRVETVLGVARDYNMRYDGATLQQLVALKTMSKFCMQEVEYTCRGIGLLTGTIHPYAFLRAVDGDVMAKWVGADIAGDVDEGCACHALNTCPPGTKCRCDSLDSGSESGIVSNKEYLPLTGFRFGLSERPGASGSISVGSFKCAQEIVLPESCEELEGENKPAGEYVLKDGDDVKLEYCDLSATDSCASMPCQNDGVCNNGDSSFSCSCLDGYNGRLCEIAGQRNECGSNPCHTGGVCVDGVGRYHCICKPGLEGDACDKDIDECAGEPCENGGTCFQGFNSFTCHCPHGYEGDTCHINSGGCGMQQCSSTGGDCVEYMNSVQCRCNIGFSGEACETDLDECESNPCARGATCEDRAGSFACVCPPGFTGRTCNIAVAFCEAWRPCRNGGVCMEMENGYVCNCSLTGHTGDNCTEPSYSMDKNQTDAALPPNFLGLAQAAAMIEEKGVAPSTYSVVLIVMGISDVFIIVCVLLHFIKKRHREIQQDMEQAKADRAASRLIRKQKLKEREERKLKKEMMRRKKRRRQMSAEDIDDEFEDMERVIEYAPQVSEKTLHD